MGFNRSSEITKIPTLLKKGKVFEENTRTERPITTTDQSDLFFGEQEMFCESSSVNNNPENSFVGNAEKNKMDLEIPDETLQAQPRRKQTHEDSEALSEFMLRFLRCL